MVLIRHFVVHALFLAYPTPKQLMKLDFDGVGRGDGEGTGGALVLT